MSYGLAANNLLLLIEECAAVNKMTRTGLNPLVEAAQHGQAEAAKLARWRWTLLQQQAQLECDSLSVTTLTG